MNNQKEMASIKTFAALAAGLLIVPVIAACGPDTAQTPTNTPAAQTDDPAVTGSPAPTAQQGMGTVVDVAASEQSLSTLTTVIQEAGLTETLQQDGPYTVFAPTDQAFAEIPEETRERLLQPENRETLRQILSYHVVPGQLAANELESGQIATAAGEPVNVQVDQAANQVRVNDATVTQPNLQASNGVIHIVDRVILPPGVNL